LGEPIKNKKAPEIEPFLSGALFYVFPNYPRSSAACRTPGSLISENLIMIVDF
jgi:hypothetical protein